MPVDTGEDVVVRPAVPRAAALEVEAEVEVGAVVFPGWQRRGRRGVRVPAKSRSSHDEYRSIRMGGYVQISPEKVKHLKQARF